MGYINEFKKRIHQRDFTNFIKLWEEYLTCDTVDGQELIELLGLIKQSDFRPSFGTKAESILPLWEALAEGKEKETVLLLLFDLQTTNSSSLIDVALDYLEKTYQAHPMYRDWLRITGVRSGNDFRSIIRKFALLNHMKKGNFVYHTGGWGTGEIMDLSFIREEVSLEFENVGGKKELSFQNAFNVLDPLPKEHFYACRFYNPDAFEAFAKKEPVTVIKQLLKDLGPKNAQEIKEEMFGLVIPEEEWAKWWQSTRAKLKKDTHIELPKDLRSPFCLLSEAKSENELLAEVLGNEGSLATFIPSLYAFLRDQLSVLKEETTRAKLMSSIERALQKEEISFEDGLQLALILEQYFQVSLPGHSVKEYIQKIEHLEPLLDRINILALKKRTLEAIKKERGDWAHLFIHSLKAEQQAMIRDYLIKELVKEEEGNKLLEEMIEQLIKKPSQIPATYFWYVQKALQSEELPYATVEGKQQLLEGLLVLLAHVEHAPQHKEIAKKIYLFLTQKRFKVIRDLLEEAKRPFLQEFLLLASKCHSFPPHEQSILESLVAVVDPSFSTEEKMKDRLNPNILWVTKDSLDKAHARLKQIGTVEIIENAKEIEEARAHGDLRENAEYKFAQEKRRKLQEEMRRLSQEVQEARVITTEDIETEEVGIGNVVYLVDPQGQEKHYTLLGPWDADPEKNILSFQSKFAEAMRGKGKGERFAFREEEFLVKDIQSSL